jgi:hypothetical protein
MPVASQSRVTEQDRSAAPYAVQEIERITAPPPAEFAARWLRPRRPVIITNLTADWRVPPAQWTFERMVAGYGDSTVVAAALADGTLLDDPKSGVVFRRVVLRDFVRSLPRTGAAGLYVMAPTWNFPEAFQHDYRVPAYCVGAPHRQAKVWLGKGGTMTPTHRDVPHNLHVHLTGRKRWLLFSPRDNARMYPRGLFSGMPNFASVDPEHPDFARHPRFREATAFAATVGPGETLFIPHGWWHHTRTLDDAVSMNFWWGGQVVRLASTASTLFKRLRRIRQDEWAK